MSSVAICGGDELREAASALGLTTTPDPPALVLVDADDDAAVEAARRLDSRAPRVFVAGASRVALLEAAGVPYVVARPLSAAVLGPVLFRIERSAEVAPRLLVFVSAVGAAGRTSLVANLAVRLAKDVPVVAVDATGTGALAWRLGKAVAPWADIGAVGEDLGEAHLRLAAAECAGALILGGVGTCADALLLRVVERARAIGVVLVDAPSGPRAEPLLDAADRAYVCANPDPASAALAAALFGDALARGARLVVSQAEERDARALATSFGLPPTYLLPRDERACREALVRRAPTGGRLGRAYDAFAELVLADVTS